MAKLTDYQRKYLFRLNQGSIEHGEFARWGKRAVATVQLLAAIGYAQCVHPDDGEPYCPNPESAEGWWEITPQGMAAIGHDSH